MYRPIALTVVDPNSPSTAQKTAWFVPGPGVKWTTAKSHPGYTSVFFIGWTEALLVSEAPARVAALIEESMRPYGVEAPDYSPETPSQPVKSNGRRGR